MDIPFQNGHIKTEAKTENRRRTDQIRVFLFELGEIGVAYGEICLTVIGMMWMAGE